MKNLITVGLQVLNSLLKVRGGAIISLMLIAKSGVADGEIFYYSVSYSHQASTNLARCPIPISGVSDSRTVILNSNAWRLSVPGLTAASEPCNGNTIGCAYRRYKGRAVNLSLLYALHGTNDSFQLRCKTSKGFLYSETLFLDCYWGAAGAHGSTSNDAQVEVIFSLSQSGRVRVVGTSGYTIALQGEPILQRKQGSHTAEVLIFDITDPIPVLVYSWAGTQLEPGGIFEIDDTVYLNSGRVYAFYMQSWSSETVEASSPTAGSPAVLSSRSSGAGGASVVITLLYEKGASSEDVTPELIRSDVNGDRCVDDADLLAVMFCLGETVVISEGGSEVDDIIININSDCLAADVNMDGTVDDADLLTVLFYLGVCY